MAPTPAPPPNPNPWDGINYDGLATLAKKILLQANAEEPGSVERAQKMAAYEAIVNEIKRRVFAYVTVKLELPPVTISDEALAGWKLSLADWPPDIQI
jgi:hypothetical protein